MVTMPVPTSHEAALWLTWDNVSMRWTMLTHGAVFSGSRWFNTARAEDLQHKAKTDWVVLGTLLVVEENLNQREEKLKWLEGTSLAVQCVKTLHFPGTKIPNAMRCSQKVKNKISKIAIQIKWNALCIKVPSLRKHSKNVQFILLCNFSV